MGLNAELVKTWFKENYINFLEVQIIELELEVDGAREQYIKNIREALETRPASQINSSALMATLKEIEEKSIELNRELVLAQEMSPQNFYEALVDFVKGWDI